MNGNEKGAATRLISPCALILVVLIFSVVTPAAHTGGPCDDASFIHNYPVFDVDAYAALFNAVEGYVPGPETEKPWPVAEDNSRTYRTRDFCPLDPDDRVVRLFEVSPAEFKSASLQPGTLTLVARDLGVTRDAATALASTGPRDSEFKGRRSFFFVDTAGNEFFVWEHPGPPDY